MAIPLIPFVTGAIVGAVATFAYKDENAKQKISDGSTAAAKKVTSTIKRGTEKVKNVVSRKSDEAAEESSEAAPA